MKIFTIDIHCLIRQWDAQTGHCVRSYILETPSQESDQNKGERNLDMFKSVHMISTAVIDPSFRKVAVAFQKGFIQINNIYSGAVLYNKQFENMINCGP
jgi:hypothetical protein